MDKAVIRTEEIYDAATDDESFDRLAATLADAVGARSGVLHWGRTPQHVAEISYSGYFSDAQMALYDEEFQGDDIWGVAIGRESCREKVCQEVSISVVAVSFKKKNIQIAKYIKYK